MNNDILSRTKNTFCILGCYILLYDDHIWLISTNGPGAHRCKWAHFNQTGSFLAVWVISYLYELLVGSCIFISNGYWGKLNGSFLLPIYCSKHKKLFECTYLFWDLHSIILNQLVWWVHCILPRLHNRLWMVDYGVIRSYALRHVHNTRKTLLWRKYLYRFNQPSSKLLS